MITSMMCSTITSVNAGGVDFLHQRDRLLQFGRRQPRERLVEQHQARLARKHARDLEPLAAGRAERAARAGFAGRFSPTSSSTSRARTRAAAR